jgi:hypothetical protein
MSWKADAAAAVMVGWFIASFRRAVYSGRRPKYSGMATLSGTPNRGYFATPDHGYLLE